MYNCLSLPFIELQVDSLNKNRSEMSKSRVYGLKEEREREKKKICEASFWSRKH